MRTYNEKVVRSLSKEQFLEQHPEAGVDYDKITNGGKVPRKVTQGFLDKNPDVAATGVKVGDMYPM